MLGLAVVVALLAGACSATERTEPTAAGPDASPAGRVRRETTTPAVRRGPIFLLGDSIMVGAHEIGGVEGKLEGDGWTPEVVAQRGATLSWGIAQVRKQRSIPETVVVALGTNPGSSLGAFSSEVRRLVSELQTRGALQILWIPPSHADVTKYEEKIVALGDLAGSAFTISQWGARLYAHPEWFTDDKIHLSGEGYQALASFIADEAFGLGRRVIFA